MKTTVARDDGRMSAARMFANQPERVAAAWRRLRYAQQRKTGEQQANLLDSLVESFVREVGMQLAGAPGSAWTRARGVLRVSHERGPRGLYEEFSALRRCLTDALDVVGATSEVRRDVNAAVDEAVDSAVGHGQFLLNPGAEAPSVPFGGIVVEYFERPVAQQKDQAQPLGEALH